MDIIGILGAMATGGFGTLVVKAWIDRRDDRRGARREFYIELLQFVSNRQRMSERLSWDEDFSPPDIPEQKLDELQARLLVDASPEVRRLANENSRAVGMVMRTHVMGSPASVDEHGLMSYDIKGMHGLDEESRKLRMRVHLGQQHDEVVKTRGDLARQVRREIYGRRQAD